MTPQTVHVYPNNDLIEHDTDGGDCPCGPTPEPVFDADGACGWVVQALQLARQIADREKPWERYVLVGPWVTEPQPGEQP